MKNNNTSLLIVTIILLMIAGVLLYFVLKPKDTVIIGFNTNYEKNIDSIEIYKGDSTSLPVLDRDNYEFLGWYIGEVKIDNNYAFNKSVIIDAKWQVKEYLLSFDTEGGNEIESIKVKCGLIMLPASPTKKDFTFVEWRDINGKKVDNNSALECVNQTIFAVWKGNDINYTITFDSDGGSEVSKQTVKAGEKIIKPTDPTKEGYIFKEWQLDGTSYNFDNVVKQDITLKAIWVKNGTQKMHKVTFIKDTLCSNCIPINPINPSGNTGATVNCVGGGCSDEIYVVINVLDGNKVTRPADPQKKGYTFKEWQWNGNAFDFDKIITEDITVRAVWIQGNSAIKYTVTFNSDGGTAIPNQLVQSGGKAIEPKIPVKNGYIFKEWQLNGVKYDFNNSVTKNIILKAIWEKNAGVAYTISLSYGDIKSLSVKCNTPISNLPTMTSTQTMVFIGWFDQNDKIVKNGDIMPCLNISLKAKYYDVSNRKVVIR